MASVTSGKAGRNAALFTERLLKDQLNAVVPIYEQGWEQARGALTGAYGPSKQYLKTGYQRGRKDVTQAVSQGKKYLGQGYDQGLATLQEQYGQATDAAQRGAGAWEENLGRANTGYDMYMNALGLGGEGGRAAAEGAFKAGPGYQYQVDQATQQAQRAANKVGGLYGGNTQAATTRLASNLANQEYGNWTNQLQGFQGAAGTATSGYAGQLNNLAGLYQNQGRDVSTLQVGRGKDLAAIGQWGAGITAPMAYSHGSDQASLRTNLGSGLASAATGRMQDIAGAYNNYYNGVIGTVGPAMQAGQQAAANRMGMMSGFGQMGMQLLGGMGGMGGGILGGLGKLFGG